MDRCLDQIVPKFLRIGSDITWDSPPSDWPVRLWALAIYFTLEEAGMGKYSIFKYFSVCLIVRWVLGMLLVHEDNKMGMIDVDVR
ncbi:hypothetical protein GALMADRAFT_134745 [Galerina marginata CBS 339.88]|uniref:Uncharacterized protein n=1 Tax=Galerina marginata (strain CBS 339.88) TaxID=685588 RepID=A0A067TLP4_GALM3|nr:hypothetical protein GALMADRAFT_134745 [Galerina marginata CBS 339.88]